MELEREPSSLSQSIPWLLVLFGIPVVVSWLRSISDTPNQSAVKPVHAQSSTDINRGVAKPESGTPSTAVATSQNPDSITKNNDSSKGSKQLKRFRKAGDIYTSEDYETAEGAIVRAHNVMASPRSNRLLATVRAETGHSREALPHAQTVSVSAVGVHQ